MLDAWQSPLESDCAIALHCIALHCIALYYNVLYCITCALHSDSMPSARRHGMQETKHDIAFGIIVETSWASWARLDVVLERLGVHWRVEEPPTTACVCERNQDPREWDQERVNGHGSGLLQTATRGHLDLTKPLLYTLFLASVARPGSHLQSTYYDLYLSVFFS